MKRKISGSTFLITGSGGNLGLALSLALGKQGAHIIGLDANEQAILAAKKQLTQEGISHYFRQIDLTNEKAVRKTLKEIVKSELKNKKGLDGLILNAGITRIVPFSELDFEQFQKVFQVNVFGAVLCAKEMLTSLREANGVIVGISSVSGFAPLKKRTAYSASKHALSGFLESLRSEEENLDVLVVYPSFLETGIRERVAGQENVGHNTGTLSPYTAAQKIVTAIEKRKKRLYIPFQSKLARAVWNRFPDLYMALMKKRT